MKAKSASDLSGRGCQRNARSVCIVSRLRARARRSSGSLASTSQEFILRPRPIVSASAYREAFKNEGVAPGPSVRIIKDGPIREWIHAADMVMSSFSTTLLEAAVAGKPAYAIEPVPFVPDVGEVEWVKQLDRVTSFEAFRNLLRDPRSAPTADRLAAFAREVAHPCDDAMVGAADIIKNILASCAGTQSIPYRIPEPRLAPYLKRMRRRVRDLIGVTPSRAKKPFESALNRPGFVGGSNS